MKMHSSRHDTRFDMVSIISLLFIPREGAMDRHTGLVNMSSLEKALEYKVQKKNRMRSNSLIRSVQSNSHFSS